jgi:hypothetical protein
MGIRFDKEKSCFVADDGSKLHPTYSVVNRFGNCCVNMHRSQRDRWQAWLVKELYGLSPRPRVKEDKDAPLCVCGSYDHRNHPTSDPRAGGEKV